MSIRFKILLPLLGFLLLGASVSVFVGLTSVANQAELQALSDKTIDASDASREARDQFDGVEQLTNRVMAMTDFVAPDAIAATFNAGRSAVALQLSKLKTSALSPTMSDLAQESIDDFSRWESDAQVLLGLRAANEIATTDAMLQRGRAIRAVLNKAVSLAGHDARFGIAEASARTTRELRAVFGIASAVALLGLLGAFRIARSLSNPMRQLVQKAERLAGGDVEVELTALDRTDEVGDIARAVEVFRGNVRAQMASQTESAEQRRIGLEDRARHAQAQSEASAEQITTMATIADALARMAKGDLTVQLENIPPTYARLETDFNTAISQLRDVMRSIARSSQAIEHGSGDTSVAARDLSGRTEQQAASLHETSAALARVMDVVRKTANGVSCAATIVSKTKHEAEKSGGVVGSAIDAMSAIERSSGQIGQIVGVIDQIAFQTNLLALNAGVEAARAGDTGRGFAVVASEVRALAQRSAEAAKEIKTLISNSSQHVTNGVDLVGEAARTLSLIVEQVTEINGVVKDIAGSAGEQVSDLDAVNVAVNRIGMITQQNATQAEETNAASHKLSEEAQHLATLVGHFNIDPIGRRSLGRAA